MQTYSCMHKNLFIKLQFCQYTLFCYAHARSNLSRYIQKPTAAIATTMDSKRHKDTTMQDGNQYQLPIQKNEDIIMHIIRSNWPIYRALKGVSRVNIVNQLPCSQCKYYKVAPLSKQNLGQQICIQYTIKKEGIRFKLTNKAK